MIGRLARLRVPLGFACAGLALWLARPTVTSVAVGMAIALAGEALRIWAAGHIEKGREVTRSGPYRLVRHPLYLGSAIMGAGFVWAAQSLAVTALVSTYLVVTLAAAVRTEERALSAKFGDQYEAYREGRSSRPGSSGAAPADRPFSWSRVVANREYRAIAGLLTAAAVLYLRS
jgi:protein-S-isoprenylcysteine O-methyltransferase Ste14